MGKGLELAWMYGEFISLQAWPQLTSSQLLLVDIVDSAILGGSWRLRK